MTLKNSCLMLLAAAAAVPAAAHAEAKPTIVVMHRNIQNAADEANWQNLALGLSADGFRVVSVALKPAETATEGRDHVVRLLNQSPEYGKLVLVGTAAASDVVSLTAESEAARVDALVYISAEPTVATLGPRTVLEPTDLVGKIPAYQIKISNGKRTGLAEAGARMIRVREEGNSTLAKVEDMTYAIATIAKDNV